MHNIRDLKKLAFSKRVLFLLIAVIIILAGALIWGNLTSKQNGTNKIKLSSKAEVFNISGKGARNFLEVIFDPLELKEGEKQKIIASLKNPEEIESFKAILKDGRGLQEKEFKPISINKNKNQAFYQIIWMPQGFKPKESYPVEFEYLTKLGEKNKMTLFWHSAEAF